MPRQVRNSSLESRAARGRLRVQHKPFYRLIEPGLHLGYRKLASGPGTWIARRYTASRTCAPPPASWWSRMTTRTRTA